MATGNLPPFEDREAYGGFFPALLQTWVGACFRPTEFFESVGNSQDLTPALRCINWVDFRRYRGSVVVGFSSTPYPDDATRGNCRGFGG